MRKKVVVGIFISLIFFTAILSLVSVSAATNSTDEQKKIDDAYKCLEDKAGTDCSTFSLEEKTFSLLADNLCRSEVISDSSNESQCWPSGSCKVKTTAQAVLALDNSGTNTEKAQDWLMAQNRTPTELAWYLEIESSEPTTCTVSYSGRDYNVNIGENKKISNNAGACLVLSQDDYWLRIAPSCYDEEFEVSCNQNFLTTLLFKKATSSTIHVSDKSSSASAEGTTTESVNSFCLADGNVCSYEGTLWAAMVLDSLGKDVSQYMPYLVTLADDNSKYIPEAFLYFITADEKYRTEILAGQKSDKWWIASGDKFYDTSLALLPFQGEDISEKTNSKQWLFDVQGTDGCWESNVRDTAFILASLWPQSFSSSGSGDGYTGLDCESSGYYCVPSGSVTGGEILSEYDCPALYKCSTSPVQQQTCSELGGSLCSSNQICQGGTIISSGDSNFGESCCIQGTCTAKTTPLTSECVLAGGVCRTYGCGDGEQSSTAVCDFSGETCCVPSNSGSSSGSGGKFWLWFFFTLIILVVVGIFFRDKLRIYWLKMKSKFGGKSSGSSSSGPGPRRFGPPSPPHGMLSRRPFPERRILLPGPSQSPKPRLVSSHLPTGKSGAQKELDEVLKKLKEMGK